MDPFFASRDDGRKFLILLRLTGTRGRLTSLQRCCKIPAPEGTCTGSRQWPLHDIGAQGKA